MRNRSRQVFALLLVGLIAACGSAAPTTTTSTTIPTTTSTSTTIPPTTTTTIPPFEVENAPPELTTLVESFYEFSAGRSSQGPALPDAVTLTPIARETPRNGVASVGVFGGQSIATVEMGNDLFLAVDDGSGWRIVGGAWPDLAVQHFGSFPRLVAVIGSDARPGENQDRSRADSIHIVGLDGSGGGGVVGIPRDAYVPVTGIGNRKINAALSLGGPDVMLETLRGATGLPIEGYALTGFEGFRAMVGDVLGGMEVEVPFSINDKWAKAYFEAGRQLLNGKNALAFARPRKTLSGGDFARSELQGMLILAAAQTVSAQGFGAIPKLLEGSYPWLSTDMSPEQLLTFSAAVVKAELEAIPNIVVEGRGGRVGSASVVHLSPSARDVWADLADGRIDG